MRLWSPARRRLVVWCAAGGVLAVQVGVALAWCGLRPARRAFVWLVNLAALWVVPALFISVNYVLGTRLPERDPQEMALRIRQILSATGIGPDGGAEPTVLPALAIGLAGAAVQDFVRRRRRR